MHERDVSNVAFSARVRLNLLLLLRGYDVWVNTEKAEGGSSGTIIRVRLQNCRAKLIGGFVCSADHV